MVQPKISVIIPVYNGEKYLDRCISSILSQTFKEFECLVVNDCSTDNSLEVCNTFKKADSRIKVYHKEYNGGTAQARKTGVSYANAEYIIFVDQDDWIESTMLEELYTKIRLERYDMVYCDFYDEYPQKTIYRKQDTRDQDNIELIKEIIAWDNFLPVIWNKLVKAEIYQKVDFPKITYSEDRAIMVQVLYFCNKIGYINKGLYHWCHIPKSASRASERKIRNIIEDYISYIEIILFLFDAPPPIINEFINEAIDHIDNMGFLCSYNEKILNEYKNSINKIIKMKIENILTNETLSTEINKTEINIRKLDKKNMPKKIIQLIINWLKKNMPRIIKEKIKTLLKHGHGA
jgi:glycosyltransferase involved in cell wall biosynthesis